MLRLSKLTDYGIVIMTCLASKPDQVFAANQVSECTHVALPTVSKILKQLSQGDLVLSIRGPKGGYRLARPSTEISVAEVVAVLEGPVSLTECSADDSACEQADVCPDIMTLSKGAATSAAGTPSAIAAFIRRAPSRCTPRPRSRTASARSR